MTEKTVRITKTQRYEDLMNLLHGNSAPHGTTLEEADAFIAHEVELLVKKNGADRKETDTQKANEKYRGLILEFLSMQDSGKTCTEIAKGIPDLADFNNQKVAALMRQLVEGGRVVKSTVKGKSLFTMA